MSTTARFSVEAIFHAVDKMSAPIKSMTSKIDTMIKASEKGLSKVASFNDKISGGIKRASAITAGAAFATAAIVKDVVTVGAEFDRTLVTAAAKFDPAIKRGTQRFEELRQAAEDIGERTEFNAQQGAEALKALAASGFKAGQAIAVLPGIVDLATASEVDLGTASEMATKALGAFGLKSENSAVLARNLARVTDVMAMSAGKTEASMEGLFESIKEGGPISVAAGQKMETFMAMAAKLAGAGIEGSVAGTTLKNVFATFSTKKGTNALAALGVKTQEANGKMRDAVDILADVEKKTKGMGSAKRLGVLEGIFGKIPLAGVSTLLDQGAESIRKLRGELEASSGATKKMADAMRDTVAGDIDGFTSAIDGVKIALFSTNNGPIRDVIKGMTKWVAANKKLIVQKIGDTIQWIADHMEDIVKWAKRIGIGILVFYTFATAVKGVQFAIEAYEAAVHLATGANWLFKTSIKSWADTGAPAVAAVADAFGLYNAEVGKAGKGLEGIRAGLNASALGESINGVTSKLGQAGLLGAALAVGLAFGTWLNETFEIDEKINDIIDHMANIGKTVGLAKQTTRNEKGEIVTYGKPTANLATSEHRKSVVENEATMKAIFATPAARRAAGFSIKMQRDYERMQDQLHAGEKDYVPYGKPAAAAAPQVVSPADRTAKSISESTTTEKTELLIRDETGRAELPKRPAGTRVKVKLQPSGPL